MFEREIEKDIALNFYDEAQFETFTDELQACSGWMTVKSRELKIVKVPQGSSLNKYDFIYSSPEVVEDFEEEGGLMLDFDTAKLPINLSTAPFTMDDRAGARSKLLSDYFGKGMLDNYAEILNNGLSFYGNNTVKLLVRGGRAHAMHTNKYVDMPQARLYSIAKDYMSTNFPTSSFKAAGHDAERTYFDYAVCESRDSFFDAYASAWIKAGLPEPMLRKSYPMITFATGDTGKQAICITPKLKIGNGTFPLGTEFTIKHTSSATEEAIRENCTQAFSQMQKGLNTIENMINTELVHPYAAFVKAASSTGIVSKAKAAIKAVLENFKDFYAQGIDKVTAFDVYYEICQIENYGEFDQLSAATKLQVLESLNRLINLDWKKIDVSGREEF